jgi:ATP-dependent RNA helicase DeaD
LDSFEELGLAPELVEALAAEGIERPTPLQQASIPVVRNGANAILVAGPGGGLLMAWAPAVLDRLEAEGERARVLVLTATAEVADRLGESVARLGAGTGHAVAALGSPWVLPERAHVVLGAPADVLKAVGEGRLSLESVDAVVVDQAQAIEGLADLEDVERVLDYVPATAQRVLTALPMTPAVADLASRHVKRAVTLPSSPDSDVPSRGSVRFRVVPEPREASALGLVDELLAEGARHVLVFCRSEDHAADIGDYLTLRGYVAGAPGDASVPVWLGVDALAARAACKGTDGLVVLSCDAPTDPDELDRRHAIAPDGVVVVVAREVAHLRDLGRRTGYATVPFPPPARPDGPVGALRRTLERALSEEDIAPYLLALEPLFERYDPAEVAAAAVALLRRKPGAPAPQAEAARSAAADRGAPAPAPPWAKLFIGVGERDGLRPGDLVGAITGEAGVPGDQIGRIDIKESHSVVEVHDSVAKRVIRAINGTTIKGRAVRADFDRPRKPSGPRGRKPAR